MLKRYTSDIEFLQAIDNVPVTVDQWQLEKLALATRKARVSYCVPGLPKTYLPGLWGKGFHDPSKALDNFFSDLPAGSRVAVVPEGPYVLAKS